MPLLNQSSLHNSRNHNRDSQSQNVKFVCRFCKKGYKLNDQLTSHKKHEHGEKMKVERELQKLSERKLKIERKLEKLSKRDRQIAMSVNGNGTDVTNLKENVPEEKWATVLLTDTVEDTSLDTVQSHYKNKISGAGESSGTNAADEDTSYDLLEGELTSNQSKSYENGTQLLTATVMETSSIGVENGENGLEAALEVLELEVLLSVKDPSRSYDETNGKLKNNFCDPAATKFSHPELSPSTDTNMTILRLDMSPADLFGEKSVTTTTTAESETTSSVMNTVVEEGFDDFESSSTKSSFDSDVEILPTPVPEKKVVEVIDLLDDSDNDIRDVENESVPSRLSDPPGKTQNSVITMKINDWMIKNGFVNSNGTRCRLRISAQCRSRQQRMQSVISGDRDSTNTETITAAEHMDYSDIEFETFPTEIHSKSSENCTEKEMQNGCNSSEEVQDRTHGDELIMQDNNSQDQHQSAFTINTSGSISTPAIEVETISANSSSSINVDDSPSNLTPATVMETSTISAESGENGSEAVLELEVLLSEKDPSRSYDETYDELKNIFCDPAATKFSYPELSPSTDTNMTILRIDMSPEDLFVKNSVATTMESEATTSSVANTVVEEDCDDFESSSTKSDFDSDVEILPTPVPEKKVFEVIDLLDDSDDDIRDVENESLPNRLSDPPGKTSSISVENDVNGSEAAVEPEVLFSGKDQGRSYDETNDELENYFCDASSSEYSHPGLELSPSIETDTEMTILRVDKSGADLFVEKSVTTTTTTTTTTTLENKDNDEGNIVPPASYSRLSCYDGAEVITDTGEAQESSMPLMNASVTKEFGATSTATNALVEKDCDELEPDFDSDVEILPTPVPEIKVVEVISLLDDSDDDIHDIENQSVSHPPGSTQNSEYRLNRRKHAILNRTRCFRSRSQAQSRGRQHLMQKNINSNESRGTLLDCTNRARKISETNRYSTHLGHMDTARQITRRFEMVPSKNSKYGPEPGVYNCSQCGYAFSDASLLSLHVRHAHPPEQVGIRLNSFWKKRR